MAASASLSKLVQTAPGAGLQAIGLGQAGDIVVAVAERFETLAHLIPGGARLETEERIREIAAVVVGLWREVIGFGFALLSDQCSVLVAVVYMVGERTLIVEEL